PLRMRSNRRFGKYFSNSISPGRPHQAERWPSSLRCSNGHLAYNIFVRVKFEKVCLRSFFFGQVFPSFWVSSTLSSWLWRTRENLACPRKVNFYYSYGKKEQEPGYQRKDRVAARGVARDFARRPCASPNAVSTVLRE